MKKVHNGPLTRLLRTLGFILVLASSLVISVQALLLLNVNFITNNIQPLVDILNKNFEVVIKYRTAIIVVGGLIVMWTQSKSVFFRIVNTILVGFSVVGFATLNPLAFGFGINNEGLRNLFANLVLKYNWFSSLMILAPMFLVYLLLVYKKPHRISVQTITAGMMFVMIALIGLNLQFFVSAEFLTASIYLTIMNWISTLGFVFITLGSAFGVLGILRK